MERGGQRRGDLPLRDFSAVPVNERFSLRLVERSGEGATVTMPATLAITQETGVIHGGLLASVADTAAVYAFLPDLPQGRTMASIEFKMNFLRAGRAGEGDVRAVSRVLKAGRTVGVCEAEVSQGGHRLAKGLFTYMFYDGEPPSR